MKLDPRRVVIGAALLFLAVIGSLFFIKGPSGDPIISVKIDLPPAGSAK